jgi:enoyl-CoA hydratase/carnithine racemase
VSDVRRADRGGVAVLVLDRPTARNAMRPAMVADLRAHLAAADADPAVRAVVVTGAGAEAFSVGQDLQVLTDLVGDGDPDDPAVVRRYHDAVEAVQAVTREVMALRTPTVAAVNGVAVGFGSELALACDVRIASTTARMGFVEARTAIHQTNGVTWLLPRMVGHGAALDLLLTGDVVDAAECHRLGLVTRLAPPEALLDEAVALAGRIAANGPATVRRLRRGALRVWDQDLAGAMAAETDGMVAALRSHDLREGVAAFLQKRPPRYEDR